MVARKILTEKQKEIIKRKGLFVVKARPGSGKTFAVAARLARLLWDWQYLHRGIVVISFTNVAWQEIEEYLSEEFNVKIPISYPHFLGTIDSFLNQYVFLPFGHLIMGCNCRPQLIGPPINNWEPIGSGYWWQKHECNRICKLNQFSYDSNDNLINIIYPAVFSNCTVNHTRCTELKKIVTKAGFATQRDANYFAMKVLQKFPQIAKAIIYRFPVLMMDEAQDTSDVEMRTVELLIENGLKEVMLIGDPEQAIFEWRDAKPELLESKYEQWKDNSITLDENWRSSQEICNFFNKISTFEKPPTAMNIEVQKFGVIPKIWEYTNDNYREIIRQFLDLCESHNVSRNTQDVAVLARSRELLKIIQGRRRRTINLPPWQNDITEAACESKFLFDKNEFRKAFYRLEKAICKKILDVNYCSYEDLEVVVAKYSFVEWRKRIYQILSDLPETNYSLGEWVDKANGTLGKDSLINPGDLAIKGGQNKKTYASMNFDSLFSNDDVMLIDEYRVGTVHSVKGETLDAVLLILKKIAGDRRKYANMLDEKTVTNEELRIVYVAITRPRKVLVVAVPVSEKSAWGNKFLS